MKMISIEEGREIIKEAYKNRKGCELSEEDNLITIRIKRRLLLGERANSEWFRKTNFFLKKALQSWNIPFNTIEFDDYISYNFKK